MNSKMKLIKEYKWHLILLLIYLGLNSWIYITWITREFDSDFVGGIERTLLVASNLFVNVVFFTILSIIGRRKKEFRKLYIITSLLSLVSIGLLILTGE
jgi:cyanate permease